MQMPQSVDGELPGVSAAFAAVIRQVSSARSLADLMLEAVRGVRILLQAEGAAFVLREGDSCHYAEEDAVAPLWKGRRFPMTLCISGWCMLEGAPAVIHDVFADPRIPTGAYKPSFVRCMAMVPVGEAQPTAALGAYWSADREIAPQEMQALQAVADAVARSMARVDPQQTTEPPPL